MDKDQGFKRILLATDGSSQAETAVDSTIALARFSSAIVRVVHVWNLELHHRHGFWDVEVRTEAERLVQQTIARLTAAGVTAEKEIFRADSEHVAAAIALIARQFLADLVVVGSRGLSDWKSIFGHSVSHQVLSALDCPVLVVRGRPMGDVSITRRIVVAVAGGDDILPAVRATVAAAHPYECSVTVVHVAQAIFGSQGFAYVETDEEIRSAVNGTVELLREAGVPAEGVVVPSGPVAKAVAGVAANCNADLIVVGSSRMGDITSLLLGSVSHQLLHDTDVPVLVAGRLEA